MTPIRVLLVDDSVEFLASASGFLLNDARVHVVGVAHDGREGARLAGELAPDLVLMDLSMPVMDGLSATRLIKTGSRSPRVVIVSLHQHAECRRAARDAGADGFIGKSAFAEEVLAEVDAMCAASARPSAVEGTS